jgi:hypothetical protein
MALLFSVHFERFVIRAFHSSLLPTVNVTDRTSNKIPEAKVPICHQNMPHVLLPSLLVSERSSVISVSFPLFRFKLVILAVALKSLSLFIVHHMPNAPENNCISKESEKMHDCQDSGLKLLLINRETLKPNAATENVNMRLIA